jgi:cysteine sulfinate desulfinase/cysteine desulfurase-like protein
VGADPKEIIFTSGATESNNLAIKGVASFYKDKKRHIITSQVEREAHLRFLQTLSMCLMYICCMEGVAGGVSRLTALWVLRV